jgi:hypothetical protein
MLGHYLHSGSVFLENVAFYSNKQTKKNCTTFSNLLDLGVTNDNLAAVGVCRDYAFLSRLRYWLLFFYSGFSTNALIPAVTKFTAAAELTIKERIFRKPKTREKNLRLEQSAFRQSTGLKKISIDWDYPLNGNYGKNKPHKVVFSCLLKHEFIPDAAVHCHVHQPWAKVINDHWSLISNKCFNLQSSIISAKQMDPEHNSLCRLWYVLFALVVKR